MDELLPIVEATLADLHAPRQLETIYDVKRLQAALQGKPFEREPVAYNHPINWEEVKQIPRNQTVRITTSKGDLILQLHVESAPGSVWNFLNTVRAGEYNGRYFHRVVPNFVIQGGCPRGDGWGAPDWTQRSEFSNELRYERGSVGLASVGEDTEGVQFFITHCATPHLDGRYTIFATVIDGLEVIDMIHVGDQILSVEEIKSTPATQTSSSH
ncbi:MAG: peptidylprolyl isomerase [Bacteroidetes bacterium]|nr:peptidylprolyl isomerase [Bacteroidota bacterium]